MAAIIRGTQDPALKEVQAVLETYEQEHPGAEATLYRQNPVSIRIRIIGRHFERMSKSRRHDLVVSFLRTRLDDETMADLSLLLLFAPSELRQSLANMEFENPVTNAA